MFDMILKYFMCYLIEEMKDKKNNQEMALVA